MDGEKTAAFWLGVKEELEKMAATWGKGLTAQQRFVISRSPGKKAKDIKVAKNMDKGLGKVAATEAPMAKMIEARQKTPKANSTQKPAPKKPSRQLGMGEETMEMGDNKMAKQPNAQPQKPPRY